MTETVNPQAELHVVHDRAARVFRVELGGEAAVLNYELSPGTIDFTHTGVPEAFRGRGVAALLTRAGLEFARDERQVVIPSCSYVANFIRRHPEYERLLQKST